MARDAEDAEQQALLQPSATAASMHNSSHAAPACAPSHAEIEPSGERHSDDLEAGRSLANGSDSQNKAGVSGRQEDRALRAWGPLAACGAIFTTNRRRWLLLVAAVAAIAAGVTVLLVFVISSGGDGFGSPPPGNVSVGPPPATPAQPPAPLNPNVCTPANVGTLACDYAGRPRVVVTDAGTGIVATDQGTCSLVAAKVLRDGGHAVDAAVASALCLGVVNAFASGLGGGDIMLVRLANGSSLVINSREPAPAAASQDMYAGLPSNSSTDGGLAVGVPLQLKGLWEAWTRFGRQPWAALVLPAADLARTGFPMHPYLARSLTSELSRTAASPAIRQVFLTQNSSTGAWQVPAIGDMCCQQPALAATLDAIAQNGAQWLYSDAQAGAMAAEIQAAGGIITAADLQTAQPRIEQPMSATVGPYEFIFPPPPSSAVALVFAFRLLAGFAAGAPPAPVDRAHRLVETLKTLFAVRTSLGDPGTPDRPLLNLSALLTDLASPQFANGLRGNLSAAGVLPISQYGGRWNPYVTGVALPPTDQGTSHVSVLDAQGNAVSVTQTINYAFGSNVMSASTGIIYNNEMDDFSIAGQSDTWLQGPAEPNLIAPGKLPLSSMSPMVVLKAGQPVLVIGGSGGTRMLSALLQTLQRLLLLGQAPLPSVAGPRVHDELDPNVVYYENYTFGTMAFQVDPSLVAGLAAKGDVLSSWANSNGVCQFVSVNPVSGVRTAASDPRKDGCPAAENYAVG